MKFYTVDCTDGTPAVTGPDGECPIEDLREADMAEVLAAPMDTASVDAAVAAVAAANGDCVIAVSTPVPPGYTLSKREAGFRTLFVPARRTADGGAVVGMPREDCRADTDRAVEVLGESPDVASVTIMTSAEAETAELMSFVRSEMDTVFAEAVRSYSEANGLNAEAVMGAADLPDYLPPVPSREACDAAASLGDGDATGMLKTLSRCRESCLRALVGRVTAKAGPGGRVCVWNPDGDRDMAKAARAMKRGGLKVDTVTDAEQVMETMDSYDAVVCRTLPGDHPVPDDLIVFE